MINNFSNEGIEIRSISNNLFCLLVRARCLCLVVTSLLLILYGRRQKENLYYYLFYVVFRVSLVPTHQTTNTTNKSHDNIPPIMHDPYKAAKATHQT